MMAGPNFIGKVMENVTDMNKDLSVKLDLIYTGITEQNDLLRDILDSMNGQKA